MSLVYWKLSNARATLPALVGAYTGDSKFEWDEKTANIWPATKAVSPYGQLPYLKDGDVVVGQSMAIVRYLARKYKLDGGDDLAAFGKSESLVEEFNAIYGAMGKAKSGEDEYGAYVTFFEEYLVKQFGFLEALLTDSTFFCGGEILVGDLAILAAMYCCQRASATHLDAAVAKFPKLSAWRAAMLADAKIAAFITSLKDVPPYFAMPEKKA